MKKYNGITVGVLALQGDFERHQNQLQEIGAEALQVKLPTDLERIDALIIPGGESTTMDKLIDQFDLREPIAEFAESKPIWGTCAGMIMVSKNIDNNLANVKPLKLMDIDVVRNGYGRQIYSFEEKLDVKLNGKEANLNACFIRAPKIVRYGKNVNSLALYNDSPVLVSENNILASSFHTELDNDTTLLRYFLDHFLLAKTEN
jgi:5'-phosphate synthase pdxT subunit